MERVIKVKKVAEEWEIWNKKEEVAKLKNEAKKLVLEKLYKCIHMFRKKASERIVKRREGRSM